MSDDGALRQLAQLCGVHLDFHDLSGTRRETPVPTLRALLRALGVEADKAEGTAELLKQAFETIQPIKRAGLPEDIARAALFFASDESSFINGRDIVVDGGLSI
mgnify:CR=1 FL=1